MQSKKPHSPTQKKKGVCGVHRNRETNSEEVKRLLDKCLLPSFPDLSTYLASVFKTISMLIVCACMYLIFTKPLDLY